MPPERLAERGVRVLKLAMTYPLVPETVVDFAGSVDEVVVIEEKRPFIETQLRSMPPRAREQRAGVGQARPFRPSADLARRRARPLVGGERIWCRVMSALGSTPRGADRTRLPLVEPPARAPAFCSGCPHNRSTVFPAGALVGGGVGCHGIMYFEARHQGMKSLPPTPMGAEGVPWIGLAPFVAEPHLIQNLGDGTLSHSGTLAIRASRRRRGQHHLQGPLQPGRRHDRRART